MQKLILSILFIFFITGTVLSGTIDPTVSDEKYIEYGSHFNYVGKLCGEYGDRTRFCASAVVLKEHIILTAAHVVKGYQKAHITINDKQYEIDKFIWPNDFSENIYGMNDIAIGFVSNAIKLDFYPELYDKDDELNKVCCIAGYGLTGTFNTGAITSDSKRRAGSNVVENIDKQLLVCRPSRHFDKSRTSLEFIIASGDSGGGLFIDSKLAGINSCITGEGKESMKSTYVTESCHTRVSIHREWILDCIDKY
jgi:hypothetical protein